MPFDAGGGGEDIGKRHLSGLVDEEHVDGASHVPARPQPRGAGADVRAALRERLSHGAVVIRDRHERVGGTVVGFTASLLNGAERNVATARRLADFVEQSRDDAVAVCGDSHAFAGLEERYDHPRSGTSCLRSGDLGRGSNT